MPDSLLKGMTPTQNLDFWKPKNGGKPTHIGRVIFDGSLEGQLFPGKEFLLHPFTSEATDKPIQEHFFYVLELTIPDEVPEGGCIVGDGLLSSLIYMWPQMNPKESVLF